jgi:mono/diheme cytochrome c family protein
MPLRLLLIFSGLVAVSLPCAAAEQAVLGFVQQHCVVCHGASQPAGDLNLASVQGSGAFDERRHDGERVVAKLKTGEMPPAGLPRPDEAEADLVILWLQAEFARQDAAIVPQAGRVTARRLNRNEYNNTNRRQRASSEQLGTRSPGALH